MSLCCPHCGAPEHELKVESLVMISLDIVRGRPANFYDAKRQVADLFEESYQPDKIEETRIYCAMCGTYSFVVLHATEPDIVAAAKTAEEIESARAVAMATLAIQKQED